METRTRKSESVCGFAANCSPALVDNLQVHNKIEYMDSDVNEWINSLVVDSPQPVSWRPFPLWYKFDREPGESSVLQREPGFGLYSRYLFGTPNLVVCERFASKRRRRVLQTKHFSQCIQVSVLIIDFSVLLIWGSALNFVIVRLIVVIMYVKPSCWLFLIEADVVQVQQVESARAQRVKAQRSRL